uniref:Taste receptor type 2 n=1 Tax=Cavia porcellus TaxID=10141 RepID=A0A286XED0_CAVPO
MAGVMPSIFRLVFSVEFTIGNLGNVFIILVNCMDLINRRKISLADQLLTALAISRIVLLWILFTSFYMNFVRLRLSYAIWSMTFHFNAWLATCLSIFYCLKIANFSNSMFLYFKWRVKKVVLVTLLVSLVLLFLHLLQLNAHLTVLIDKHIRSMSYNSSLQDFPEFSKLRLFSSTMFTFIAFALSMTTFFLLIFSLWKHLNRMQCYVRGSRDASTTAHIKALQAAVAFLLLYTIFFLSLLIQFWRPKFLPLLFYHTVEIAFPSIHSFVLILGNSKLKQTAFLLLKSLKCRSKDAESLGS